MRLLTCKAITATPVLKAKDDVFLIDLLRFPGCLRNGQILQVLDDLLSPIQYFEPLCLQRLWRADLSNGFQRAVPVLSVGDVRKAEPDDTLRLPLHQPAHVVGLAKLNPARADRARRGLGPATPSDGRLANTGRYVAGTRWWPTLRVQPAG